MSKLADEFVELTCPKCGGAVKIDKATLEEHYVEADGVYVYLGTASSQGATCTFCDTKFARKQRLAVHSGVVVNTGGAAFIGGSVTVGGDFVGGDKVTFVRRR